MFFETCRFIRYLRKTNYYILVNLKLEHGRPGYNSLQSDWLSLEFDPWARQDIEEIIEVRPWVVCACGNPRSRFGRVLVGCAHSALRTGYVDMPVKPFYWYPTASYVHISFFATKYLMVPSCFNNLSIGQRRGILRTTASSRSRQATRANDASALVYAAPNPWLPSFDHRETILVTPRVEHWRSCCTDSDSPSFNKLPQGDMGTDSTRLVRARISIKHPGSHTWRLGCRLSQSWRIWGFEQSSP